MQHPGYNGTSVHRISIQRPNDSTWRSQSPKPNAENERYDQRDPAQAHWDRERSNGDVGLINQSQQMTNGKNAEKNAGDA